MRSFLLGSCMIQPRFVGLHPVVFCNKAASSSYQTAETKLQAQAGKTTHRGGSISLWKCADRTAVTTCKHWPAIAQTAAFLLGFKDGVGSAISGWRPGSFPEPKVQRSSRRVDINPPPLPVPPCRASSNVHRRRASEQWVAASLGPKKNKTL